MKIGKPTGSPAPAGSTGAQGNARTGSAAAAAAGKPVAQPAAGSATVTLSATAGQLQNAIALAGSGEVFDAKQVESIKQAITNGQFQVNPEKVADKLIQSVQEMLKSRSHG